MVLVAVAMVAMIAMAALSIDVVTLYLAKEEAQRSADAGALAAAKVISLSGVTGDPHNTSGSWQLVCGPSPNDVATQAARAVAQQTTISGVPPTVQVFYSAGGSGQSSSCATLPFASGINNPLITVQVSRPGLPVFFARIWGNSSGNSVTASATAEVFNPSNSASFGNVVTGTITPVHPRCVKPWIVPNLNPRVPNTACTTNCSPLVGTTDGRILNPGVSLNGGSGAGVIGEQFWLTPDCRHRFPSTCSLRATPPQANYSGSIYVQSPPNLQYLPGEISGPAVAVPSSCTTGRPYEQAIDGCDQSTVYQCGVHQSVSANPNRVDLNENPGAGPDDTMNGVKCLIHQADENDASPSGQDVLDMTAFPFKISSGSSNPLLGGPTPQNISNSSSIVSLPIYDSANETISASNTPITIVGFLQVFINRVDANGNVNVTVLNVAGCSNGNGGTPVGTAVAGSSPVPVRLVTNP